MLKYVTLQCGCEVEIFVSDTSGDISDGRMINPCAYHKNQPEEADEYAVE